MPKIEDIQINAFTAVIAANLNANVELVRDYTDTFGQPILPVQHIIKYDVTTGRAVLGGNTTFPALGAWRTRSVFAPQTNESRSTSATCVIKYILNANNDTERMFAVLSRFACELDNYLEGAVEDELGGDILIASGLIEWAVKWDVDFKYEASDKQALYPTATGRIMIKHDRVFDSRRLQGLLTLFMQDNLKGVGSEGDDGPVINPLLSDCLPNDGGPP